MPVAFLMKVSVAIPCAGAACTFICETTGVRQDAPHSVSGAAGVAGSHMAGHIVLTGRAKDTIVLSSGENVEPGPIEDACAASTYIQHMVLLGQDQRMLGALVMPAKEAFDELESVKGDAPCPPQPKPLLMRYLFKCGAHRTHLVLMPMCTVMPWPCAA